MIRAICYLTIVFSFYTQGVPVNAAEAVNPFQVNNKERLDSLKRSIMDYARTSPIVRQQWIDCGASVYRWVVVLFGYRYLQGCKGRQNRNQVEKSLMWVD